MNRVYINKISALLPNEPIDNSQIETVLGMIGGNRSRAKSVILRSNGIKTRYYVLDPITRKPLYTNASLTAKAIRGLADDEFRLDEIECLACGTTTPDLLMPNHALMTHGELGISPCEAVATTGICLSGVSALKYGFMSVASGNSSNAVCTGSEIVSLMMRAEMFEHESNEADNIDKKPELAFGKDFLRWMLSDGAGAMRLQSTPNKNSISLEIKWIDIISNAGEMPTCMMAGARYNEDKSITPWRELTPNEWKSENAFAIEQDVKLLNENITLYTVEKAIRVISTKRGISSNDIDYFLPHYSSEYFRDDVALRLKNADFEIPFEKWFTNLSTKGNTGSASIYIIIEELFNSSRLKKGEKILCYIPESGRFSTSFMLLEVV